MTGLKRPIIDLGACSRCGACIEVAATIFSMSAIGSYIEVSDLGYYDPDLVEEAIRFCPEDCIYWDEDK